MGGKHHLAEKFLPPPPTSKLLRLGFLGSPSLTPGGSLLRLEEASRRWLIHCLWLPIVGSGKWTGKVWMLFSFQSSVNFSFPSWWSRGCVVGADCLSDEQRESASPEDDIGHFVYTTTCPPLRQWHRSLWSPCQWVLLNLWVIGHEMPLDTASPTHEYVTDGSVVYDMMCLKLDSSESQVSLLAPSMGHSGLFQEHSGTI